RFHIFLIIIKKQDVDQIDTERTSAEQIDHFSYAFPRSDMCISKAKHEQEEADCRGSHKRADVSQCILIMVARHRRNAPCDPERCSHTKHTDNDQCSLAYPDMPSVFIKIISCEYIPGVHPVADQRQIIICLSSHEPQHIIKQDRACGHD